MKNPIKCAAQVMAMLATTCAIAQSPLQLDPSFSAPQLSSIAIGGGVFSALPLNDGTTLIGEDSTGGFPIVHKLLPSGARDPSFTGLSSGDYHLQAWQDMFYAATLHGVGRFYGDGSPDYTYGAPDSLGGMDYVGDYYLYPDGSIVLAGESYLTDTADGWVGAGWDLTWFTPSGHLDNTHTPRQGNGNMSALSRLDDGSFLISGFTPGFGQMVYDGHPVRNMFKVDSLGVVDTTFNTTMNYGLTTAFLPLSNGKTLACGFFMFDGDADTMQVVRLMPDGSLDTTFNNHLSLLYSSGNVQYTYASIYQVLPLSPDSLIIVGSFNRVDGIAHDCIALIDSTGHLRNEIFPAGSGARSYTDIDGLHQMIYRITAIPSGGYYICGAYHGYSDGANTDNSQWAMSRLYGFNVGIHEQVPERTSIRVYPDPATTEVYLSADGDRARRIEIIDILGQCVLQSPYTRNTPMNVSALASGTYTARLFDARGVPVAVGRFVKE